MQQLAGAGGMWDASIAWDGPVDTSPHVVRGAEPPRGTAWGDKVTYLVTRDARGEVAFVPLQHEWPEWRAAKHVAEEMGMWSPSDEAYEEALPPMPREEEVPLSSTAHVLRAIALAEAM